MKKVITCVYIEEIKQIAYFTEDKKVLLQIYSKSMQLFTLESAIDAMKKCLPKKVGFWNKIFSFDATMTQQEYDYIIDTFTKAEQYFISQLNKQL